MDRKIASGGQGLTIVVGLASIILCHKNVLHSGDDSPEKGPVSYQNCIKIHVHLRDRPVAEGLRLNHRNTST
jgi:hypothetical protein